MMDQLKARLLQVWFPNHDEIYDSEYYEMVVEGPAARSANTIANSIISEFGAKVVADVGCGTGALLEALRERGCEVFGMEYAEAALSYCRGRRLNVTKFDLERDSFNEDRAFDVAVSMEVAEHLPETVADRFVTLLADLAPVVVLTAAPPGQGGKDHVNEQVPEYWIEKFQVHGFEHAKDISRRWREDWKAAGNVEWWYYQNLLVFQRNKGQGLSQAVVGLGSA